MARLDLDGGLDDRLLGGCHSGGGVDREVFHPGRGGQAATIRALSILEERFAKSEISMEEYAQRSHLIQERGVHQRPVQQSLWRILAASYRGHRR